MRHRARIDPEVLRSAAHRLELSIGELQENQQRLRASIREVEDSWRDAKSRDVVEKLEELMKLVDLQIRDNQEVCNRLKRKADRLSEYLDHRIR